MTSASIVVWVDGGSGVLCQNCEQREQNGRNRGIGDPRLAMKPCVGGTLRSVLTFRYRIRLCVVQFRIQDARLVVLMALWC